MPRKPSDNRGSEDQGANVVPINVIPIPDKKTSRRRMGAVQGTDMGKNQVITLEKSQPKQLSLFQTFVSGDPRDDYSNTIELYESVPKYFASKKRMAEMRQNGKFLDSLIYRFRHRDIEYTVRITPARVVGQDGSEKEYYPTWREELVEEALKKIACSELNGVFLDNEAGVQFTLYELHKELKNRNHEMRWNDLIRSLKICRSAGIIIEWVEEGRHNSIDTPIFPVLALSSRDEWKDDPQSTRCYVKFNPLVTRSINQLSYRQFNYTRFMSLKRQLARWFLKRLSHLYLQASWDNPYEISLSRIVQDSALVNASRTRDKMRYVDESLDELSEAHSEEITVLMGYEKKPVLGARGKIENVTYRLTPHPEFVGQMKKANKRNLQIADDAFRHGLISEATYGKHASKAFRSH